MPSEDKEEKAKKKKKGGLSCLACFGSKKGETEEDHAEDRTTDNKASTPVPEPKQQQPPPQIVVPESPAPPASLEEKIDRWSAEYEAARADEDGIKQSHAVTTETAVPAAHWRNIQQPLAQILQAKRTPEREHVPPIRMPQDPPPREYNPPPKPPRSRDNSPPTTPQRSPAHSPARSPARSPERQVPARKPILRQRTVPAPDDDVTDTLFVTDPVVKVPIQDESPYPRDEPLAEERKEILRANKEELKKSLMLLDHLLELLWDRDVIPTEKRDFIMKFYENQDKVGALVTTMLKQSNGAYDDLCRTLREVNQGHVVDKLLLKPIKPIQRAAQRSKTAPLPKGAEQGLSGLQLLRAIEAGEDPHIPHKERPRSSGLAPLVPKKPNKMATREADNFLSKDRWNQLRQRKNDLMTSLDLVNTEVLSILAEKGAISQENKRLVQFYEDNGERVEALLEILLKKTNGDYDSFCDALDATGQSEIIKKYLITDDDMWVARRKIAEHYEKTFKDTRLVDRPSKTRTGALQVPITWHRTIKDRTAIQDETLDAYYKIFSKINVTGDTRVVVEAESGGGKTTLVRRLCHLWAPVALNPGPSRPASSVEGPAQPVPMVEGEEQRHLRRYTLLLCILLRHVSPAADFKAILLDQYSFLSTVETYSLLEFIKKSPRQTVILLDGLEEMPDSKLIQRMLSKKVYPDVRLITTTDPSGLNYLRTYGTTAMEQHLKMTGFTKQDVSDYIDLYYEDRDDEGACALDLVEYMNKQKPGLWGLARLPLQTEMLCVVWEAYWKVGSKQIELYQDFAQRLLYKLEQNSGEIDLLPQEEVQAKYSDLLMALGKLSNQWHNGRPRLVYDDPTLQRIAGNHEKEMTQLGFIVKSDLGQADRRVSKWEFCHSAIQEYFIAYHMAFSVEDDGIDAFCNICPNVTSLESKEVILKYLCHLQPSKANKVFQHVLKNTKEDAESKLLLRLLFRLVPEYQDKEQMDFSLPGSVDVRNCASEVDTLKQLLDKDQEEGYQNVRKVTADNLDILPDAIGQSYVEELNLSLSGASDTKVAMAQLEYMGSLEVLELDVSDLGNATEPIAQLLESILPNRLRRLVVSGYNILQLVAEAIDRLSALEDLVIKDSIRMYTRERIANLCAAVNSCENLKSIRIETQALHELFLAYDAIVGLTLVVYSINRNAIQKFLDKSEVVEQLPHLTELYLGKSDLCGAGPLLGQLLVSFQMLQTLTLDTCEATWETLERLLATVKKSKQTINLTKLHLVKNFMQGCGTYLGTLFEHAPRLEVLSIIDCQLNSSDLSSMEENLPPMVTLKEFEIADECLGGDTSPLGRMWQHMPLLERLRLNSSYIHAGTVSQCFGTVSTSGDILRSLRLLDVSDNKLADKGLETLAGLLPSMPSLESLDVANCASTNVESAISVLNNLPPRVKHLNIGQNEFGNTMTRILEGSSKMNTLSYLNIGGQYGTEYAFYELHKDLKEKFPNMEVTCGKESLWTKRRPSESTRL